ncbi:hypothetical protein GE061_015535 [Apolygus lucorum]|uniref:Uncharacterized protein n=1 Tax=Apolygus lucorum TaxID=248454 RepID=A0A8S9XQC0_APOLU|nr:hypothetical protein GE061_015535 [Apolygus lucorum]
MWEMGVKPPLVDPAREKQGTSYRTLRLPAVLQCINEPLHRRLGQQSLRGPLARRANSRSHTSEGGNPGEVERLLLEYRQNQELVRNIGAHYYQIIYPVQLRHHEKMGISTREVGAPKFPPREGGNAQSGDRERKSFPPPPLLHLPSPFANGRKLNTAKVLPSPPTDDQPLSNYPATLIPSVPFHKS